GSAGAWPRSLRADDPAGDPVAGIAGRLAGVVVGTPVHDHRLAHGVVGRAAAEHHAGGMHVDLRHAIGVGDDVVHVAAVVGALAGAAVRAAMRVEVTAGTAGVGRAAVTVLMDMD